MMFTGAETQLALVSAAAIAGILGTVATTTTSAISAANARKAQKKQHSLAREAMAQSREDFLNRYPEVGDEGAQTAAKMAEKRRRQQRYGGRASTILTSPLGIPGGQTRSGAKTLTGT
jgi:type II secretory pathway pseudopilin PulG|tara:strand:+ start:383 stop:736 length:354 start_codon:yes stop_codon:yes gene_type:complete